MPSHTAAEKKKNKKKATVKSIVKAKKSQLDSIMGSIRASRPKKKVSKKKK